MRNCYLEAILRLGCRVMASLILLVLSLPALANYHFTYTSQPLPLTSYLIDGYPQSLDDIAIAPPVMSLSFNAVQPAGVMQSGAALAGTTYWAKDFSLSFASIDGAHIDYPLLFDPSSYAQVALAAGQVVAWDLMLQLTELITPETDMYFYERNGHWAKIRSSNIGGDEVINRFHPFTWHGEWIQLALIEHTFSAMNNLGVWVVTPTWVPEPGIAGIFLAGIAALCWHRRRRLGLAATKICLKSIN